MTTYADRLAAMDDEFDEAPAAQSGRLPDGEYLGVIQRFDFWEKEGGGPLKLITEIKVDGGEHDGMSAPSVWHELEDPERIKWTKGYFELLGLKGIRLSEIETKLEPLAGTARVQFSVVTSEREGKVYRNVYVNELVDMNGEDRLDTGTDPGFGESDFGGGAAPGGAEDDIPF